MHMCIWSHTFVDRILYVNITYLSKFGVYTLQAPGWGEVFVTDLEEVFQTYTLWETAELGFSAVTPLLVSIILPTTLVGWYLGMTRK